jgi:hypothetical protein
VLRGVRIAGPAADTGVVHRDVEPAESLDDDLYGLGRLVLGGRVARHRDAGHCEARGRLLGLGQIEVEDGDACPL